MSDDPFTTLSVRKSTKRRVQRNLRGGESYSDLLEKMCEQYQAPEPGEVEP